eukprot:CAMPEP_0206459306 /NCGR_PEP_ID=MMETSP0324_2-20121206/24099_1 /ASSEMBLY_ACC=CAM_ASM_000836 /TAXON_ID=2866 /ORGANISM="Crypthecodinium cohnii, Strain Seligo" /LENGTH=247 /DNA_ID=CAMNT_0053930835 /DNA_START=63 /DNA_END=806 /DNA_ORIENTATION=+
MSGAGDEDVHVQSQADLDEDERLARQLQAEEDAAMGIQAPPNNLLNALLERILTVQPGLGEGAPNSMSLLVPNGQAGMSTGSNVPADAAGNSTDESGGTASGAEGRGEGATGTSQLAGEGASGSSAGHDAAAAPLEGLTALLRNEGGGGNSLPFRMDILQMLFSTQQAPQGIRPETVQRRTITTEFKKAHASDNEEARKCMICLDFFEEGTELRILPCLHRYHRQCIDSWFEHNRCCPVCKHDVTKG